jgi:hypothetical protein
LNDENEIELCILGVGWILPIYVLAALAARVMRWGNLTALAPVSIYREGQCHMRDSEIDLTEFGDVNVFLTEQHGSRDIPRTVSREVDARRHEFGMGIPGSYRQWILTQPL